MEVGRVALVPVARHRLGLLQGRHVLVHDEHLGDVDALVVHGVVVRFVHLDGTGEVDEARGVGGTVAVEVPEGVLIEQFCFGRSAFLRRLVHVVVEEGRGEGRGGLDGWLARDPLQVEYFALVGA